MARNLAELSDPFFAAAAEGRLVIPRCDQCNRFFFYPTVLCPHCHTMGHTWVEAAGTARVYSFTAVYRAPAINVPTPYVVGVVELPEGIRMMTNIVDCSADDVSIGMPVKVRFGANWEGRQLPFFAPADSSD
jgi:uncharacterized protein